MADLRPKPATRPEPAVTRRAPASPTLAQPSDADPAATAWMLAATALVLLMSAATAGLLWALIEWRRL